VSGTHEPADARPRRPAARAIRDLLAPVLAAAPTLGWTRLVCVDGPAGSGKTTLAGRLAAVAADIADGPVTQVHMDDLYEGWGGLHRAAFELVPAWLLAPLAAGRPGRYRRYDWSAGQYAEWHEVPAAGLLVIEGCGSAAAPVDAHVGLRIWVEAPPDLRLRRGLERDGPAARKLWLRWRADEAAHFAADATRARADVRVDGAPMREHDPRTEVVLA